MPYKMMAVLDWRSSIRVLYQESLTAVNISNRKARSSLFGGMNQPPVLRNGASHEWISNSIS